MRQTFDLGELASVRQRELAPVREGVQLGAFISATLLLGLFLTGIGGNLPSLDFAVSALALAIVFVSCLLFLLTRFRSSAASMAIDASGIVLVRPPSKESLYSWKVVQQTFRVIDHRGWEGRAKMSAASKLVLCEPRNRRTALTDAAFDALVAAAKKRGLELQSAPFRPGSPTVIHGFSASAAT